MAAFLDAIRLKRRAASALDCSAFFFVSLAFAWLAARRARRI